MIRINLWRRRRREREARPLSSRRLTGLWAILITLSAVATTAAAPAEVANGTTAPSLWLSPLEIHFGSVAVGQTARRTVAVHNLGNAPLVVDGGGTGAPFAADLGDCAGALPGGATCEIVFTFSPTSRGDFEASFGGGSNAGPWGVALEGRGVTPELQVSPRSLDFGRGTVGGDYPEQVVIVTNVGGVPVDGFSAPKVESPFIGGLGTCTTVLQPGRSCRMSFDYAPQQAGVFRTTWTAQSSAGPIEIEMQGRTYSGIEGTGQGVTPRAIDFGPVALGGVARQKVTFRNHDPSIPIVNWDFSWIADDPSIHFSYEDNCGESLPGYGVCEVTITYKPVHHTDEHIILSVLNSQGIVDIHLWGEGAMSEIVADSPAIDLGLREMNTAQQSVRFTNLGRARAELLGLQSATSFSVTDSSCGDTLAPGESCEASVRFEPDGFGRFEGTVTLLSDREPAPVHVVGGMATPQLTAAFAPAIISPGQGAILRLTFANPNEARTLFGVTLNGVLPPGLELAGGPHRVEDECGEPEVVDDGPRSFTLTDATITAGKTCVVELDVIGAAGGTHQFVAQAESNAGPSAQVVAGIFVTNDAVEMPFHLFVPSLIGTPSD